MLRRILVGALLIAAIAVASQPAYAQGQANGPPAHSSAGGNASDGGSPGNSRGAGKSEDAAAAGRGRLKSDEDAALEAVLAQDAVPLQSVLDKLRQITQDRLIDAELLLRGDILVYQVKVMSADGFVRVFRYDAASGQQIRLD
jgi:hypothetical protein